MCSMEDGVKSIFHHLLCPWWSMSTPAALGWVHEPLQKGMFGEAGTALGSAGRDVPALLHLLAGPAAPGPSWRGCNEKNSCRSCSGYGPAWGMILLGIQSCSRYGPAWGTVLPAASYSRKHLVGVFNARCWPGLLGHGRWHKILRCGTENQGKYVSLQAWNH